MVLRKGVSLDDDRRTGLAIVTGRGDGHQITASHLRQTRRPIRSISTRRARDPGRGRRPASPPVVAPPASGGRQRRDATRADPVRAAAAASSSSFRLPPPWSPPSVTRYSVTRYKPKRKGRDSPIPSSRGASGALAAKPKGAASSPILSDLGAALARRTGLRVLPRRHLRFKSEFLRTKVYLALRKQRSHVRIVSGAPLHRSQTALLENLSLGCRASFRSRQTHRRGASSNTSGVSCRRAGDGFLRARLLGRDDFSSNRHPALAYCWSMIFSENRYPLFGIML